MRLVPALLLCVLGLASPAAASGFSFAGLLRDGGVPFEGSADLELSLHAGAEDVVELWSEIQTNVVVVGGVFALDVGSASPLPPELAARSDLFLQITVEGDELSPRVSLASVPVAERAVVAGLADSADDALALGGTAAEELATVAALQTLGGASVAWANLSGLPTGVADGDTGTPFTPGAGVSLSGGQLSIANDGVQASHLAAGGVGSADLASASVGTSQLADGAVQGGDVADGSIANLDFADNTVTATKLAGTVSVYRVQYSGCMQAVETLMTTSICTSNGSCPPPSVWDCATAQCTNPRDASCANILVGALPTQ